MTFLNNALISNKQFSNYKLASKQLEKLFIDNFSVFKCFSAFASLVNIKIETLSSLYCINLYDDDCRTNLGHFYQGRIQNLSEGGARFISEQKNPELGTKRRFAGEMFLR